jgi:hypothetical protein
LQIAEKAIGIGYEPNRGYRFGDYGKGMGLGGRIINTAPIPPLIQSVVTGQLNPLNQPERTVAEALGGNTYDQSPYIARDTKAQEMFGKNYNELPPTASTNGVYDPSLPSRRAVDEARGGKIQSSNPDVQKSIADAATLRAQNVAAQQQTDDKYRAAPGIDHPTQLTGKAWRDEYHKGQDVMQGQYQASRTINPFTGKPYGSDMDNAVAAWGKAIDAAKSGWETDWNKVDEWRAANPEQAKLVDEYMAGKKDTSLTPMVKAYKDASAEVGNSGFFDIKDGAWAKIEAANVPGAAGYSVFYAWRDAMRTKVADQLAKAGNSREWSIEEAVRLVDKMEPAKLQGDLTTKATSQWVLKNPEAAVTAWRWGYFNPGKENGQEAFLNAWLKQHPEFK